MAPSPNRKAAEAVPARPAPRCPRYESMDMFRGIACLCVVLFHASLLGAQLDPIAFEPRDPVTSQVFLLLTRFWLGVPMFFVISGYCIAATSDSARRAPRGSVGRYF